MGSLFRAFRRIYVRYLSWSAPFGYFLFDWWVGRQLDKVVDGEMSSSEWVSSASSWLNTTQPYAITFFITAIVFSIPEWWPYAIRLWSRVAKKGTNRSQKTLTIHNLNVTIETENSRVVWSQLENTPDLVIGITSTGYSSSQPNRKPLDEYLKFWKTEYDGWMVDSCSIVITNNGSETIYNIQVPIVIDKYEPDSRVIGSKGIGFLNETDLNVFFGSRSIAPNESLVALIKNTSSNQIHVRMPDYIVGETHSIGRTAISYIYTGYEGRPIVLLPMRKFTK